MLASPMWLPSSRRTSAISRAVTEQPWPAIVSITVWRGSLER